MDLVTIVMLGAAAWLMLFVFVLALCRMAARGDAAQEQLARTWRRSKAVRSPIRPRRGRVLGDV